MLILGIDTSCDDTAAAVVEDGKRILSNIVSNQNELHEKYGGIVPELASRRHIEMIQPVVSEAMEKANVDFKDISAIAVTNGPGLIGSLLVGVCFGKSLSLVKNMPMVAVNHLEGHILSIFLHDNPDFPFIALIASGGHTNIYEVHGYCNYTELSRTRDDAAGEAYDKVAKLLGIGYPGGSVIDSLATEGDPDAIAFPRANLKGSLDFSFSGLKTAVLTHIKKYPHDKKQNIAASFQTAVVDMLTDRAIDIAVSRNVNSIALSGGVAANSGLRSTIKKRAAEKNITVYLPPKHLCTDNAAMIAATGYHHFIRGDFADFTLNPKAYLPIKPAHG